MPIKNPLRTKKRSTPIHPYRESHDQFGPRPPSRKEWKSITQMMAILRSRSSPGRRFVRFKMMRGAGGYFSALYQVSNLKADASSLSSRIGLDFRLGIQTPANWL